MSKIKANAQRNYMLHSNRVKKTLRNKCKKHFKRNLAFVRTAKVIELK